MPSTWIPYCGAGPEPAEWMARWNFDPVLLIVLAAGLGLAWSRAATPRRPLVVLAGLAFLVSFISPLCALSSALFTARTLHHVLLLGAAAPLLAWAFDAGRRGHLAAATLTQAAILWAWHAPGAYAAALSSDLVYWLMQVSLLASALWFWRSLRAAPPPAAIAALLTTTVLMGLLGAVITFADAPVYAPHLLTTAAWGLTPLEDQQIAGLVMWAPAAGLYLAFALAVAARLLQPPASAAAAAARVVGR